MDLSEEFYSVIPQRLAKGEMQYSEQRYQRSEQAGQDISKGDNRANVIIVVADE